jgi:hypothetical protein
MIPAPEIRGRLLQAFSEPQADLLAQVLTESHAELVTRADFHQLTEAVHELAEAQKRTEFKVEDLAEAQKRTELRVEDLAEAQMRTEVQVGQLAEAQKQTELQVGQLAASQTTMQESLSEMQGSIAGMQWAIADLAKQVGGLSNAVGANLEDFACELVPELLEKYWRFVTASAGPEELAVSDGVRREFDVVVRGTINGKPVVVICEIKATVSPTEVTKFLRIVEKIREAHPGQDIRPLFFGYKANASARALIVESAAAMVFTRGVMIPVAA